MQNLATPQHLAIWLLLLFAHLSAHQPAVALVVQKCQLATGETLFTDRGCPAASDGQAIEPPTPALRMPGLSKQDQQKAEQLRRAEADKLARRQQARLQAQQARQSELAQRQARCQQARQTLKDIRARRRAGYSAQVAQKLDQQEDLNRRLKREFC